MPDSTKIPLTIQYQEGEEEQEYIYDWKSQSESITIGSSPSCKLPLEHPDIAPIHYRLKSEGDNLYLVDLSDGSSRRGSIRKTISEGDQFHAGPYRIALGEPDEEGQTINPPKHPALQFIAKNWKESLIFTVSILMHLAVIHFVVLEGKQEEKEQSIEAFLKVPATVKNSNPDGKDGDPESSSPEPEKKEQPNQKNQENEETEKQQANQDRPHNNPTSEKDLFANRIDDAIGLQGQPSGKEEGNGSRGTGDMFGGGGGQIADQLIFCIDVSGSMQERTTLTANQKEKQTEPNALSDTPTRLEVVKNELISFIEDLRPAQEFNVIFFNKSANTWRDTGLIPATDQNKSDVFQYIDRQRATGGTFVHRAFQRAFELMNPSASEDNKRKVIYFLSDGRPSRKKPDEIVNLIRSLREGTDIRINTIGIDSANMHYLNTIASNTGGYFKNYGLSQPALELLDLLDEGMHNMDTIRNKLKAHKKKHDSIPNSVFQKLTNIADKSESKLSSRDKRKLFTTIVEVFPDKPETQKWKKKLEQLANEQVYTDLQMARNYRLNNMYEKARKRYKRILNSQCAPKIKKRARKKLKSMNQTIK